jgi:hypothetical protein
MKIFLKKVKSEIPEMCYGCYFRNKKFCFKYEICMKEKIIFKKMTDEEVNKFLYKLYWKRKKLNKILNLNEAKNAK